MANYTVTHSCGHDQEHQLFGSHKGFGKWLEGQVCSECWKANQQSERARKIAEENERSTALAQSNGFPMLTGSEKQVVWGTSIRQQMVDSLEAFIKDCGRPEEWATKFEALREAFKAIVLVHTEASWFIENRGFGTVRIAFGKDLVEWVKVNHPEVMERK